MAIAEQSKEYCKNYFENLSQRGKKIAKQAEEYIKCYFRDIREIELVRRAGRGECGFDFRDDSSGLFVEVKGSEKSFSRFPGCYFTKLEYEKARSCQREGTEYEIHLVVGIGSESPEHYMGLGKVLLDQATAEVSWWLNRKDFRNYDC